jgi:hypothetical protein
MNQSTCTELGFSIKLLLLSSIGFLLVSGIATAQVEQNKVSSIKKSINETTILNLQSIVSN